MKKKVGITVGAIAAAGFLGLGIYQADAAQVQPSLSIEDVTKEVEKQYGGKITDIELEDDSAKAVYEIEVIDGDVEYDLHVDGDNGKILKEKKESVSDLSDASIPEDALSAEEAKEIALKEFNGTVTDLELDMEDNRTVYEVEVKEGNKEAEFKIDAVTGEVIEMDLDTEDDD